jgi:hypothetical protein
MGMRMSTLRFILPDEILLEVFSYLNLAQILYCCKPVCKKWRQLAHNRRLLLPHVSPLIDGGIISKKVAGMSGEDLARVGALYVGHNLLSIKRLYMMYGVKSTKMERLVMGNIFNLQRLRQKTSEYLTAVFGEPLVGEHQSPVSGIGNDDGPVRITLLNVPRALDPDVTFLGQMACVLEKEMSRPRTSIAYFNPVAEEVNIVCSKILRDTKVGGYLVSRSTRSVTTMVSKLDCYTKTDYMDRQHYDLVVLDARSLYTSNFATRDLAPQTIEHCVEYITRVNSKYTEFSGREVTILICDTNRLHYSPLAGVGEQYTIRYPRWSTGTSITEH